MKKTLVRAALTAILITVPVLQSGCTSAANASQENTETLTLFNLGEYIDPDVLKQFTDETGIEVKYEEALTPEEMYTKYKAGAIKYDLLCCTDYMLEKLINEKEIQEIDLSALKHRDNIGEKYWDFATEFDPENKYAVPYFWGTLGILYDTTKVSGTIDSWEVLFNHEYAGEIIMQNSMRDTYMITLKYLGYSLNSQDESELSKAQELLIAQKDDVQAYLVDEARDEVVAGNAAMAVVYSGEAYLGREYNPNLAYVVPKEGSNVWLDAWVVTKNCTNINAAQQFLDFICREDIATTNFDYIYYSTPNETVIRSLSDEERADETLVPPDGVTDNCEVCRQLDEETASLMNDLWKALKAE